MNFFVFLLLFFKLCFVKCHYSINDDVLFGITWKSKDVSLENTKEITIISKDKESFRCVLPNNVKDKFNRSFDRTYHGPSEIELLKPLFTSGLCSLKIESYWSYEICHGRYVRQYHEDSGQELSLQEYSLGTHKPEKKSDSHSTNEIPTVTIKSAHFPYYSVNMTGGTKCDLIGQSRSINVLYICQQMRRGEIYEIREVRTCQYQAIVFTNLLCDHPGYMVLNNRVNDISCYSLNKAKHVPKNYEILQKEIQSNMNSVSSFFEQFNSDTKIKVEAYKEDGVIKYKIKVTGEENPEDSSMENVDVTSEEEEESSDLETEPVKEVKSPKDSESMSKTMPSFASSPIVLQRFIAGKSCLDGGEGWWRHRVCYNKKISQYHLELQMETSEIILGLWKERNHKAWLLRNPDKKPTMPAVDRLEIYQYYSEGHFCDEIKAKRDTLLRIRCVKSNSSAISISFTEPRTCSYLVTMESSMFCSMIQMADEFGLVNTTD